MRTMRSDLKKFIIQKTRLGNPNPNPPTSRGNCISPKPRARCAPLDTTMRLGLAMIARAGAAPPSDWLEGRGNIWFNV